MRQKPASLVAAATLIAALGAVTPAAAAVGTGDPAFERRDGTAVILAWTQRIVPVGPTSYYDTWRCSISINGALYYSTGRTETSARARLASYTGRYFHCRRDRDRFGLF